MHTRTDQHFLVMPEVACGVYASVVEVGDSGGVDVWREGEGISYETVFEFGD